ncbi:hypothetical protein [Photobacterium damselae]|uniref:hypothetical protein n=1 Tax=Photobacterium damselae TaxID=38293 RepID=UPI000DA06CE7|nr:hypothetical protein [Photobacterium damselae]MBA5682602.1 hypothetical protein [Photobacterium damselae subsp. damselae]NVO74753.1 hypothetical protein [Photobacterium damselae subsp. damselae]SPY24992.1 Uncharacterised protein [Photobacterium damselae]
MSNNLSELISVFSLFVSISAYVLSKKQLKSSAYESRVATASAVYQQYLSLCLSHPDLARGDRTKIENNQDKYGEYKWFISNMLYSFELILRISENDAQWQAAIESQLMRHSWHLSISKSVKRGEWEKSLSDLIERAIVRAYCQNTLKENR